ncbi:NAD(P)H-hydrate epimerase [marine bacterium AO1-C]|nr:NAD(P)H-hydrate epimerase [marine bacterium AO1-C]
MNFPEYTQPIPAITTKQMIEVDRLMIEEYDITLLQMMENAGRNLAVLARERFLGGNVQKKRVVVMAGSGGNGGGALVCARRLCIWGANVQIVLSHPEDHFTDTVLHQFNILKKMGEPFIHSEIVDRLATAHLDLIIDGVIGYSLEGNPRGQAAHLIQWANAHVAPVLSLDTPSGLNLTTGEVGTPAIRATATMTLALPKKGLQEAQENVGELYLADISVPPVLYKAPGLALNVPDVFEERDIVRLS